MRRVRASVFVSIDGVMQAPGGPDEDPTGGFRFGGWMAPQFDERLGALVDRALGEDYDLLLGRRTYEIFAAHWGHSGDEMGELFTRINKYVACRPDQPLTWANSHRLDGDVVEAVRTLKAGDGRDLLIQGSSDLIHALMAADLIDQLTTITAPIVLGRGKRLFDESAEPTGWRLAWGETTPLGVVVSGYERAGEVPTGSFAMETPTDDEVARRARLAAET